MAIAGGATTAYKCQVIGGQLSAVPTTTLRTECVEPEDALPRLATGERVTVAGSDMAALRRLLGANHGE